MKVSTVSVRIRLSKPEESRALGGGSSRRFGGSSRSTSWTWRKPTRCAAAGAAVGIICAVLAALLMAAIALGFGPLRGWLAPAGRQPSPGPAVDEAGGLLGIWRLYRQLGRATPRHR